MRLRTMIMADVCNAEQALQEQTPEHWAKHPDKKKQLEGRIAKGRKTLKDSFDVGPEAIAQYKLSRASSGRQKPHKHDILIDTVTDIIMGED